MVDKSFTSTNLKDVRAEKINGLWLITIGGEGFSPKKLGEVYGLRSDTIYQKLSSKSVTDFRYSFNIRVIFMSFEYFFTNSFGA